MTAQRLDLTKPISAAMLARAGACPEAVALVRKHFGTRPLKLTRARLRRAARLGIGVIWLSQFLDAEALRAYDAAIAEALRAYDAATAEARRVYYATKAEALADALGLP